MPLVLGLHLGSDFNFGAVLQNGKFTYFQYPSGPETSSILVGMKKNAEDRFKTSIEEAVVSVPESFDDSQRQAIKEASSQAGLRLLDIINESTAVALSYGFNKKQKGNHNLLIFNMGVGCFDVAIVTIHESLIYEVKKIASDFSECLLDFLAKEFKRQHGNELETNELVLLRFRSAVEKSINDLTTKEETTIEIEGLYEGIDFKKKVTFVNYEDFCKEHFNRTLETLEEALKVANISKHGFDDIVLIGKLTRMSKLKSELENFFNGKPLHSSSENDIAYGAAIQAFNLSSPMHTPQIYVQEIPDILPADVKSKNLVILACKQGKAKVLEYLLGSANNLQPNDKDDAGHNAFYYAIRSGNVELLDDILINKWPQNYFRTYTEELDEILSQAYEELRLKNVLLTEEMAVFVEDKLIELRFLSDTSNPNQSVDQNAPNFISERIDLVLQKIGFLRNNYANSEKVDEIFLFTAKFIAANIHMLKGNFNKTRLPWEEMEFCLICFISSETKKGEMSFLCKTLVNKQKMLQYLEEFGIKLQEEKNYVGENIGRKPERNNVIKEILQASPRFKELYNDFEKLRDTASLNSISAYIQLALEANPEENEGRIIITRALQVTGEHIKNTLDSPKMSDKTSSLLLVTLPQHTRKVIKNIRDTLSHAYETENSDGIFFRRVQDDIKEIASLIPKILLNSKIEIVKHLLEKIEKIVESNDLVELTEIVKVLGFSEMNTIIKKDFKEFEQNRLERLVKEAKKIIVDPNNRIQQIIDLKSDDMAIEKGMFEQIEEIIKHTKQPTKDFKSNYDETVKLVGSLGVLFLDSSIDENRIKIIKRDVKLKLKSISSPLETQDLSEIQRLSWQIIYTAKSKLQKDKCSEASRLLAEIFFKVGLGISDLKWIDQYSDDIKKIEYVDKSGSLTLKIKELENFLKSQNRVVDHFLKNFTSFKTNDKFKTALEMLVLDTMVLNENNLEHNPFYLDDCVPLLIGNNLRNHLAHDNYVVDVLFTDPSIALISNAVKLLNAKKNCEKIGKSFVKVSPGELEKIYNRRLQIIKNQNEMFAALEAGDLQRVRESLKAGADIKARNMHLMTALHCAACGTNKEVVEFVLNQNLEINSRDLNGRCPLHFAAEKGRTDIVEFLLKKAALIDAYDHDGKSPLCLAAEHGHMNTVQVQIKNKANIQNQPFSPIHSALRNRHFEVAKFMLENIHFADFKEHRSGNMLIHEAIESGCLEFVNYLLMNGANVNARSERGLTSLHLAAWNNNLEIVNALILKAANVNSKTTKEGFTALHLATICGHANLARILLKHGAFVDSVDKAKTFTPLLYAAYHGHKDVLDLLLQYKANVNKPDKNGSTPLHLAARGNSFQIVKTLIEHGAHIDARNVDGEIPFHDAIICGQREIIELLFKEKKETINWENNDGHTSLYIAAFLGHKDICEFLLENEPNLVNKKDKIGRTALHAAAQEGHKDVVKLLIDKNPEVDSHDKDGATPLNLAIKNSHEEVVDILLKKGAKVIVTDPQHIPPVIIAAKKGNEEIFNKLLQKGAEVNIKFQEKTPLRIAIFNNHLKIVDIIISKGGDINEENGEPLIQAVISGNRGMVHFLLNKGASITEGYSVGLTLTAAWRGDNKIVKRIVEVGNANSQRAKKAKGGARKAHKVKAPTNKKADVNAVGPGGLTPLHIAAIYGHAAVVKFLLEQGADINAGDNAGNSALHFAITGGHVDVVRELIKSNDININAKNNDHLTPIELAAKKGDLDVMQLLLQCKGVDKKAKGINDWTILHFASVENNLKLVKYLVNVQGCDLHINDIKGLKPIHAAGYKGYLEIVEFFLNKGLSVNELAGGNRTLLHFAAEGGHSEIVEFLINQGAEINAKDNLYFTPLTFAISNGKDKVAQFLLQNGASLSLTDKSRSFKCEKISKLILLTEELFNSVQREILSEVESAIQSGALINAINVKETSLHYAVRKGLNEIIALLLKHKANPNAFDDERHTPLHYAAKVGNFEMLKDLLSHGAVYNFRAKSGNKPLDLTKDSNIEEFLKLINRCFENVERNNDQVLKDLEKFKNDDIVMRALMNAQNEEKKTLLVVAIQNKFAEIERLKQIARGDRVFRMKMFYLDCFPKHDFKKALKFAERAFDETKKKLGPDNFCTLDIQCLMAKAHLKQGEYQKAFDMLETILKKQKEMLHLNDDDILETRFLYGEALYGMKQYKEALGVLQEVHQTQGIIFGWNDSKTLETTFNMTKL